MRFLSWFRRRPPEPALALPAPDPLPPGAEAFEFPSEFGDKAPDMGAFLAWCDEVGISEFRSIRSMRCAWAEWAVLTGHRDMTETKLARMKHKRISRWRDRKSGNVTRYRISPAPSNVVPLTA